MAPRLHVGLECRGLTCRLSLAGALDRESAVALDAQLAQLDHSGFDVVVIDLSGLSSIDESGGVALAELWAELRTAGIDCLVRGLHPCFGTSPLDLLLALRSVRSHGPAPTGVGDIPAAPVPQLRRSESVGVRHGNVSTLRMGEQ